MRFDGDIVISDPCYLYALDGSQRDSSGHLPEVDWSITHSLVEPTWGGDCFGHVYRGRLPRKIGVLSTQRNPKFAQPHRAIGEYGVDSAHLGVFKLSHILMFINPNYSPVTPDGIVLGCVIKNFHGRVWIESRHLQYDDGIDDGMVSIVGRGNLDFFTWEDLSG